MDEHENFSEDREENLRIENEFLKIKLKAQYGDSFHMENSAEIPAEIENQFLKSMMAFEDEHAKTEYVSVYERIGKPGYRQVEELSRFELPTAINMITKMLADNDITLDICDGPYDDKLIYRFITEELFALPVEKIPVPGIDSHFIYEEFHPNHKADIIKRTHTFFQNWFKRKFTEYCTELSWHCITADGIQLTREDIVERLSIFFESFRQFKDDGYNIDKVNFELQDAGRGMGFSEGMLKYDAVMENGEVIRYAGPFKLYMQVEDNWWSIFYFIMPGFNW